MGAVLRPRIERGPKAVRFLRIVILSAAVAVLSACGGGGGGGSPPPSVTSYQLGASAGAHGAISPASATANAGGTTTFTVTPMSGYVVSGVSGCSGTLSGNTYTTAAVTGNCTITAKFASAFTWVSGPNTRNGP